MKQLILVLSLVIAAFVAACSNGDSSVKLKGQGNAIPVDLEKLSSEDALKELKADLEKNNADVPAVIAAVKRKFKTGKKALTNGQTKDQVVQEKPTSSISTLANFELLDSSEPASLHSLENSEKKVLYACIHTCQIQIVTVSHKTKNKISKVEAFVTVELGKDQLSVSNSKLKNKTINTLLAVYEAAGDRIQLETNMTKSSKEFLLISKPFAYNSSAIEEAIEFKSKDLSDYGTVRVDSISNITVLIHEFKVDGDSLILSVDEDFGLFDFVSKANSIKSEKHF